MIYTTNEANILAVYVGTKQIQAVQDGTLYLEIL